MINYRLDFVFSYWIFAWYLLYEFKFVSYSPKLALILGLIHNTLLLLIMIYYKYNILNILFFCIINLFIKIIPLWRLKNNKVYNIKSTIILFLIYLVWLHINNKNIFTMFNIQIYNVKHNISGGVGPVSAIINKIFS
jgi:hypothetical protein